MTSKMCILRLILKMFAIYILQLMEFGWCLLYTTSDWWRLGGVCYIQPPVGGISMVFAIYSLRLLGFEQHVLCKASKRWSLSMFAMYILQAIEFDMISIILST